MGRMDDFVDDKCYVIMEDVKTSKELMEFYKVLTDGNELKETEFAILFDEVGNVFQTVMKYKTILFDRETQDIIDINSAWFSCRTKEDMKNYLEYIFKEPIDCLEYAEIVMENTGWNWEAVFQEHLRNKQRRLWSIICCMKKSATVIAPKM